MIQRMIIAVAVNPPASFGRGQHDGQEAAGCFRAGGRADVLVAAGCPAPARGQPRRREDSHEELTDAVAKALASGADAPYGRGRLGIIPNGTGERVAKALGPSRHNVPAACARVLAQAAGPRPGSADPRRRGGSRRFATDGRFGDLIPAVFGECRPAGLAGARPGFAATASRGPVPRTLVGAAGLVGLAQMAALGPSFRPFLENAGVLGSRGPALRTVPRTPAAGTRTFAPVPRTRVGAAGLVDLPQMAALGLSFRPFLENAALLGSREPALPPSASDARSWHAGAVDVDSPQAGAMRRLRAGSGGIRRPVPARPGPLRCTAPHPARTPRPRPRPPQGRRPGPRRADAGGVSPSYCRTEPPPW
ncbi:hypothetical protein ABIB26_000570 [Arthrobacter sp. UYEF20]